MAAPEQGALIEKIISLRKLELISLDKNIELEKNRLEEVKSTINTLSRRHYLLVQLLEVRKRDLIAHERSIAAIVDLKGHIDANQDVAESSLLADLAFPDQSAQKKEEIHNIFSNVEELRRELDEKRFFEPIQRRHVHAMEVYRENIHRTIVELKPTNSPIRRIPAYVWFLIFRYRITEDVRNHVQSPGPDAYQSTPIILSQVTRFWRDIVQLNDELWRYFICGHAQIKTTMQVQRWQKHCSFDPNDLVFIGDLRVRPTTESNGEVEQLARELPSSHPHSIHLLCNNNDETIEMVQSLPFRDQSSLILQMYKTPTVEFIDALAEYFPLFNRLKIIQTNHVPRIHPHLHRRLTPPIEVLTLDFENFASFRIAYYCDERFLKEIHILHNGTNHLIGRSKACPLLEVVGITPPDTLWLKRYALPSLRHLILYGPKLQTIVTPSLVELSRHPYFHNVKELELKKWPRYKPTNGQPWSIMPLILNIRDQIRSVEVIRCVDSFIEGECLVALIRLLTQAKDTSSTSKLVTVVIDCCTGITQRDCELIAGWVDKLVVHV